MKQPNNYSWIILAQCFAAMFLFSVNNMAYTPVLTIVRNGLGLTYTEAGMTAFFIGYAVFCIGLM